MQITLEILISFINSVQYLLIWTKRYQHHFCILPSSKVGAFKSSKGPFEIMVLFVLRKIILQTRMRSHPVELDVWVLVGPFVYFHTSCVRTAKALARPRGCADSPEPSLAVNVISTIISWAGSNDEIINENIKLILSEWYKFEIKMTN